MRCGVPIFSSPKRKKAEKKDFKPFRYVAGEKVGLTPDKAAVYDGDKYIGWIYKDRVSKKIKIE